MSEPVVPAANTAPVADAKQVVDGSNEPDFSNMTGAEAKAYVESLKAKDSKPKSKDPGMVADTPKPKSDPVTPETTKSAAQEAMKKYKVKVDGQELEVEEAELLRGYGHQKAANKILQEGKAAQKQALEFVNMMKDPAKLMDALIKLGHDPRKLSEEYLVNALNEDAMDPRDKELRDAKARLKQIDDLEKAQREQVESQRREEMKSKFAKEYETSFIEALKGSGLPQTKPMVAEMAKYISRSAKIGFEMTPAEAAQLVKQDIHNAQLSLYGNSDGETLLRLLGDEAANKILQARGSKLKSPDSFLRTPAEQGEPKERNRDSSRRMTPKEWREYNRKK
jgi:hypothetical protein